MITPSFGLTATERVLPRLALDFTTAILDPRITFTRALNTATCVNSAGNIAVVNADLPRFDYNPVTLTCKGLLIEESRTNSVSNNTMVGAVAGSPGTIPTGWNIPASAGLTITVDAVGTENGISYVDLKFTGTTSSTEANITWQSPLTVSAVQNQIWTSSYYIKLQAGSLSNISTIRQLVIGTNSSGGILTAVAGIVVPTTAALITQRTTVSATMTNASTASVYPRFDLLFSSGVAINATLRIGMPQLELGAFLTSVIPTSSGVVTRNADVATMTGTNFSSWFNASEGAFTVGFDVSRQVTVAQTGIVNITDGTTSNQIKGFLRGAGTTGVQIINTGSVELDQTPTGVVAANVLNTLAISYKVNNSVSGANATVQTTDTACTIPTVNKMDIGYLVAYLNGHITKIMYWPQRVTNAEVQAFTK